MKILYQMLVLMEVLQLLLIQPITNMIVQMLKMVLIPYKLLVLHLISQDMLVILLLVITHGIQHQELLFLYGLELIQVQLLLQMVILTSFIMLQVDILDVLQLCFNLEHPTQQWEY